MRRRQCHLKCNPAVLFQRFEERIINSMSSIAASVTPTKTKAVSRPRLVSRLYARVTLVVVLAFILLAVPSEGYLGEARLTLAVNEAAGAHGFRLAAWEAQALSQKVRDLARPPDAGLDAQAQHDLVVGYSKDVARADDLAFRIETYVGGFPAGGLDVGDGQLVDELLTAGGLA